MGKNLQKLILSIALMLLLSVSVWGQSNHTITIDGTNDFTALAEGFTDISSADNAYFTWDADYLYFSIADAEADYGNMATFMYFDTDPQGSNGTTDAYAWTNNITTPFKADYVVVWKNNPGDNYIEVRQWNSGTTSWDQVASANLASLLSGDYVVDLATAAEPDGNYREVRIKRSTIGSPTKIKTCSFTEQQWSLNWRYFAWPSADWTDQNRGAGQVMSHYYGYTLTSGLTPNDANALDGVLVRGEYGNDFVFGSTGTAACFTVSDNDVLDVTGDFTVEAWVYVKDANASSRFIIDRASNWQFFITAQSVRFDLQAGTQISTGVVSLNTWHHVAVERIATANRTLIFLDGVRLQGANISIIAGTSGCVIGGQDGWYSGTPTSLFDEVKFSNKAIYDTTGFIVDPTTPLGSDESTVFYFQFEDNTELAPLDDGPVNLATVNGRPAGAYPMTVDNYISAPVGLPLPVELTKFDATLVDDGVMLYWSTATEVNNYGFEVEVSTDGENWENVGFVEGHGNSNSQQDYNFLYTEPFNNKVNFRLKQVDTDGGFEYSEVVSVLPGEATFKLNQNHPNPFNPTTIISFSLKASAKVTLKVYNALGQEVAVLANNVMDAGFHEVDFDASNLASGVYIYRLDAPGYSKTMKMMLLK